MGYVVFWMGYVVFWIGYVVFLDRLRSILDNFIKKICPKFRVISSQFSEVDELLDEH